MVRVTALLRHLDAWFAHHTAARVIPATYFIQGDL